MHLKKDPRVIVGFEGADDAAVFRLDGNRYIVQTVDFFTPIVDDPYQFGQIAAANALSDIYAMGGKPLFALNIVGFPIHEFAHDILTLILQGGADKAAEAGIPIVGGHSVDDHEPKYGLVVTGEIQKNQIMRNNTARPGDILVLTKPLGTGIISTAIKKGKASKRLIQEAFQSMSALNHSAARVFPNFNIHAVTDITGFGLLGHLREVCIGSNVSAHIVYQSLPFIKGVTGLAAEGFIPGGTKRNLDFVVNDIVFESALTMTEKWLTADAQTSGGLLISLPSQDVMDYITEVDKSQFFKPVVIGEITTKKSHFIYVK